jgi:hypothetical protein
MIFKRKTAQGKETLILDIDLKNCTQCSARNPRAKEKETHRRSNAS